MPATTASSVQVLRERLAALAPPPRAYSGVIATGDEALDSILPGGGIPTGKIVEITGAPGSGQTTLARQLVAGALATGRMVAYIDGAKVLAPRDWILSEHSLWIVRPPPDRVARCADLLLRSGAFGMVVVDGSILSRPVALRLSRLAREQNAALVVVNRSDKPVPSSALRLRIATEKKSYWRYGEQFQSRYWRIFIDKYGMNRSVEVSCGVPLACRLRSHTEVPDRRGVAPRDRRGKRVSGG